jgi:hypothetical protein
MEYGKTKGYCFALTLTLAALLSGCATSFHSGELKSVDEFPKTIFRRSLNVEMIFSGTLNGEPWTENDAHNQQYLKALCMETMKTSGLFGRVSTGSRDADLMVSVAIINDKKASSTRQALTGLTLFIMPYSSTDEFKMLAIVRNTKTGAAHKILLEDRVTHWQQLLLIPFSPFSPPGRSTAKMRERLFENLCLEIYNSGALK